MKLSGERFLLLLSEKENAEFHFLFPFAPFGGTQAQTLLFLPFLGCLCSLGTVALFQFRQLERLL